MKKIALSLALVAALGACNQSEEPEVVGGPADPMAAELANAEPVGPVSVILSSNSYRCADNSVVEVAFIQKGEELSATANPNGEGTAVLTQGEDGTYSAEGMTLSGDHESSTITYNGQSCKR